MTRDEVIDLLSFVKAAWEHTRLENVEVTVRLWERVLVGVSAAEAEAALTELAATGREFAPPVGVLLRTVSDRRLGLPEWDEVWPRLDDMARECVTVRGYRVPAAEEFAHPVVGAFARDHWRRICPAPRREDMQTHYAQLRDAYGAFALRVARDQALALAGAERPALAGQRELEQHHGVDSPPTG